MQYIQVNSVNEFNQTKQNFIRMGYKVIRIYNNDISKNINSVLEYIIQEYTKL